MKHRSPSNGSNNDHWETPQYVYDYLEKTFFKDHNGYFDPCPLYSDFDGLNIEWREANYINPPYNSVDKTLFIQKALKESKKGKFCVMLIPSSVETKIFHEIIVPNAKVLLIRRRIKFKGFNSKNEYVINKCGQSGSMFVIFGKNYKPEIKAITLRGDYS